MGNVRSFVKFCVEGAVSACELRDSETRLRFDVPGSSKFCWVVVGLVDDKVVIRSNDIDLFAGTPLMFYEVFAVASYRSRLTIEKTVDYVLSMLEPCDLVKVLILSDSASNLVGDSSLDVPSLHNQPQLLGI